MVLSEAKISLRILCRFFSSAVLAQDRSRSFQNKVDQLVDSSPKTYREIDSIAGRSKTDTLRMQYLLSSAEKAGYWDGVSYALNQLGVVNRNLQSRTSSKA